MVARPKERLERRDVGNGLYLLQEKIGAGSFGEVFIGISQETEAEVAMKVESTTCKYPQLRYEMKVLKALQGELGIPELFYYGVEERHSVLVMSLLGKSLEDLFKRCKRKFTPATVMLLGAQLVDRIEYIHGKNFIHRDVKPENFLIGCGDERNLIYVIDFGLSKKYYYPQKNRHIPFREGKSLTGTPRYASINNHEGKEQSRRDDIESLGYVLVYFCKGQLPWQGMKATKKILPKKLRVLPEKLCNGIPQEVYEFVRYSRSLTFEQKPDYQYLKGLFQKAIADGKYGDPDKVQFDWLPGAKNKHMVKKDKVPAPTRPAETGAVIL